MASLYIFLNTNLENISDFGLMVWEWLGIAEKANCLRRVLHW